MKKDGRNTINKRFALNSAPVIALDENQQIDAMNQAAAALFLNLYPDKKEVDFYGKAVSDYIDTLDKPQNFVGGGYVPAR